MIKIATLVVVLALCARADDSNLDKKNDGGRQKRLLFFDEGGTLVKTYSNPYLNSLSLNAERLPYYGNFMNPFFNFIRAFGNSLAAFTIPVSNAIVQQIKQDPIFQSSLVVIPKNPVVQPSPLCEGQRTQIPSPSLCNNFLNCWDGWAVEQECPTGLLFSNNGYCDYADNVDCKNRKLNVDKLQPQPQPVCSKDFEAFRNQLDCSEFFVCVNRQPVRFKCPADLAYSQYLGVCDYPERVDCKSTAGPAMPPFQPQPQLPTNPQTQPPSSPPQAIPNPIILPFPASVGPIPIPAAPPADSVIPSAPVAPPSSDFPSNFPSLPPASSFPPAFIPPESSPGLSLSPGSPEIPISDLIPPITSDLRPSFIKPSPAASADKPESGLFTPGCASATVAMSRQDAIRQLQGQLN